MRTVFLLPAPLLTLVLAGCLPELPEDKTEPALEGTAAGDCTDRADNDADGAFDCEDDGCAASPDCSVEPAPPEGLAVAVTPELPEDDDDLACAITSEAVDPNGDAVTYAMVWTVDGATAPVDADTVPAAFTSVGQSWTCTVTPSDGTLTGTPASATVTILQGNGAPSAPVVAITPETPTDDEGLRCAVVGESVDPDGDAVTYAWAWTVDGVDAGIAGESVDAARTSVGETWTCSVTASDGSASSAAGSASVMVEERPSEAIVIVGRGGRIASSTDGSSWMSWPSPTTADLATAECGGGVCIVVDMDNNAWRTGDQGDHWELAPLPALSGSRSGVTYGWGALATTLRYLDGRWFLGGRSRIYVSDDALRWTSVYDNPSIVNGYGHEVQLYGVGRVGDTVVFGSVGEGYLYTFLSLDGGDTWPTVTQASSSSMPGVGTNCASLPVVSDGSAFWALGWSYCDSIPYNTADAWRSAPGSVLSWSNQTPTGLFEQGMGVGSTDDGDVLFIGSSSSNGPHTCDRWVLYEDGVATTGSIGVADATCSYSYFGSLHPVAFDGNWYVPASGIGGASMMVVSGDARSWRAVDPGFEVADVTRFE